MALRLRQSTLRDVDAIADVVAASALQMPSNAYLYPYNEKYPDDMFRFFKVAYEIYIRNHEEKWLCMVVEDVSEDDDSKATIIAIALWDVRAIPEPARERPNLSVSNDSQKQSDLPIPINEQPSTNELYIRRDSAPERLKAWKKALPEFRKIHMTGIWGPYLHLQCIATHPEWQRRGAATILMNWGIATAREHRLWVGLFATPVGFLVYRKFGFQVVGSVTVQVDGEEEFAVMKGMGLPPNIDEGVNHAGGEMSAPGI